MKQPKRLTRKQKECLTAHCLNWNDWMLVEETDFCYRVINKKTGAVKSVDKFRRRSRKREQNSSCGLVGLMSFLTRLLNGAATRD